MQVPRPRSVAARGTLLLSPPPNPFDVGAPGQPRCRRWWPGHSFCSHPPGPGARCLRCSGFWGAAPARGSPPAPGWQPGSGLSWWRVVISLRHLQPFLYKLIKEKWKKKNTNKHSQDGVTLFFGGEGGAGRDGTVVLSEHRSLLGCAAPVWSTRVQGVLQVCKGSYKCARSAAGIQGVLQACKGYRGHARGAAKCAMGCYNCAQGCMCVHCGCARGCGCVHGAVGVQVPMQWHAPCPWSPSGDPTSTAGLCHLHPEGFGHEGAQRSPEISGFGKSQDLWVQ